MFHSATSKITSYYLSILVVICLLFSLGIYWTVTSTSNDRLYEIQMLLEDRNLGSFVSSEPKISSTFQQDQQLAVAQNTLIVLIASNIAIFSVAGLLCFWLARRLLHPIERAHDAQSRFTSDASHEFKTPLANMKSELEVAIRDPNLSKVEMRELLESNLEEVDRLTKLTHTLLLLSRLDYAALIFKPTDLNTIVAESVQKYGANMDRIHYSLPSEPLLIEGNASALQELFMIFIDNAIKYSPVHSSIWIKLIHDGKHARFSIRNGGKGIHPDKLPYIFDRFFRADESRTGNNGTGLGLALAKEIVRLHNGEVSVTSKKNMTRFVVELPLKKG